MWLQELSRYPFIFSPDGNFCATKVECYGPSMIEIYVHDPKQKFTIDPPRYRDELSERDTITNDGTLALRFRPTGNQYTTEVYKYKDGTYHWATEGKEQPKDLKITKW